MKIGDRVFVHGYVDEIRKDTVIIRNNGGYFGTIPSEIIKGDLVRCKDCKHKYLDDMVWNCPFGLPGGENFFCGYGAKDGDSDDDQTGNY